MVTLMSGLSFMKRVDEVLQDLALDAVRIPHDAHVAGKGGRRHQTRRRRPREACSLFMSSPPHWASVRPFLLFVRRLRHRPRRPVVSSNGQRVSLRLRRSSPRDRPRGPRPRCDRPDERRRGHSPGRRRPARRRLPCSIERPPKRSRKAFQRRLAARVGQPDDPAASCGPASRSSLPAVGPVVDTVQAAGCPSAAPARRRCEPARCRR